MSLTKIIKIPVFLLGSILFYLSLLIPRNKNIWVFGAWSGEQFADNSKYFYLYMLKNHPNIKVVWLTKNKYLITSLEKQSIKVIHAYSFKGFYYTLVAKVGFITHSLYDLNPFACGRMKIVNFWHGIPLKPVLYSDPKKKTKSNFFKKKLLMLFMPFDWKDIHYEKMLLVSSSNFAKKIFENVFNTTNIKITGYPRIDPLCEESTSSEHHVDEIRGIYLPTYRQNNEINIFRYLEKEIEKLDRYLKNHKIMLDIKIHGLERHNNSLDAKYNNLTLIDNTQPENEIYSILKNYDFLITDYSSIIFDFMILRRPIILTPFDFSNYIIYNEKFLINYNSLPYPKAKSWEEVISFLDEIIKNKFKITDEQLNIVKYYHIYEDNKNSQRVFDEIVKFITN